MFFKQFQVHQSKRTFIKVAVLLPMLNLAHSAKNAELPEDLDDDIVIVSGWVMLKSDLIVNTI